MTTKSPGNVDMNVVRWAHAWAAAASQAYECIDSISIPESPATESGRRDAMTMVLVNAVRNVVRGAESSFGKDSELVRRFDIANPNFKDLRDRFEHYEDYVKGSGFAQRKGSKRCGTPLELDTPGIEIFASEGGGTEGHLVCIVVAELGSNGQPRRMTYRAPSKTITAAARKLARDMFDEAGVLDEGHLSKCEICANPCNF